MKNWKHRMAAAAAFVMTAVFAATGSLALAQEETPVVESASQIIRAGSFLLQKALWTAARRG